MLRLGLNSLFQARRALRALRGLARLKSLIHGPSVKRQATTTLRCIQNMARVQSQIRARRIRMSEENETLQRQLQQKCEKELERAASVSAIIFQNQYLWFLSDLICSLHILMCFVSFRIWLEYNFLLANCSLSWANRFNFAYVDQS